jgi:hypothetical protein
MTVLSKFELGLLCFTSHFIAALLSQYFYIMTVTVFKKQKEKRDELVMGMLVGWFFSFVNILVCSFPVFLLGFLSPSFITEIYTRKNIELAFAIVGIANSSLIFYLQRKYYQKNFMFLLYIGAGSTLLLWVLAFVTYLNA